MMAISGRQPRLRKKLLQTMDSVAQYSAGPRGIQDAPLSVRMNDNEAQAKLTWICKLKASPYRARCVEPKAPTKALYRSKGFMSGALHLLVHQPALDRPQACLPTKGKSNRNSCNL
jgi:hypothetical protein